MLQRFTFGLLGALLLTVPVTRAQWVTQQISFQPGWNAIFLEITPDSTSVDEIFADLPVKGVYAWNRKFRTEQFEVDPQMPLAEDPHWLVWKPSSELSDALNTLENLSASTAYLVEVDADADPFQMDLKGAVALVRLDWTPGAFNLIGFPVYPGSDATLPTFSQFFEATGEIDTSHKTPGTIFEIDTANRSIQVDRQNKATFVRVRPGKAYWMKPGSPGSFAGPLQVGPMNSLNFASSVDSIPLFVRNISTSPITVHVVHRASESGPFGDLPVAVPLSRKTESSTSEASEWVNLDAGNDFTVDLDAGEIRFLPFAVRRTDMASSSSTYASYLEVTDGSAPTIRLRIPVRAGELLLNSSGLAAGDIELIDPIVGSLWVGEAVIHQVNAPYFSNTNLLETATPYNLRLIVHQDDSDQNHLLQSAVIALSPDDVDSSGLTNSSYKVFSGLNPSLPSDTLQARRISSSSFPIMDPLPLSGAFGTNLTGGLVLASDDAQNPFFHRYHPMHDNRDGRFDAYETPVETPEIVRSITFEFDEPSTNSSAAVFGSDIRTGTYRETLEGLRRDPILTEGVLTPSAFSHRVMGILGDIFSAPLMAITNSCNTRTTRGYLESAPCSSGDRATYSSM